LAWEPRSRRRLFTALRLCQPGAAGSLQLGLLRQKCLKREAGTLQPLLPQLQYLAGLIEQPPVVTYQQIATTVAGQSLAQPRDATGIQVVVRLIEQQKVSWSRKQCQQAQTGELAAAQGADRGMGIESEARLCQQVGEIAAQVPAISQPLEIVQGAAPLLDALKGPQRLAPADKVRHAGCTVMSLSRRKLGQPADGGQPLNLASSRAALARQQFEQQALADAVAADQGAARSGQSEGKGHSAGAEGQLQGVDMTCDMGHLNSCGPMRKPQAKSQAK